MLLNAVLILASAQVTCPAPSQTAESLAVTPNLLAQAQIALCGNFAHQYDRMSVELMSAPNGADKSATDIVATAMTIGQLRAGRVPVTMVWQNSEGFSQRNVLWFRIHGIANAWTYSHELKVGAVIRERDISRREVDVAALDVAKSQLPSNPIGLAVNRAARKGQLVRAEATRPAALVARQQRVRVVYQQQGMTIVTRGVALTIGWQVDDEVQVEIVGATEPVLAKVAGKDEVYVES